MNKYDADDKNVPGDVNTYIGAPGGGYEGDHNGYHNGHNGYNGDAEKAHANVPINNGTILVDAPGEFSRAQRARFPCLNHFLHRARFSLHYDTARRLVTRPLAPIPLASPSEESHLILLLMPTPSQSTRVKAPSIVSSSLGTSP